jgi:hypothetical protein
MVRPGEQRSASAARHSRAWHTGAMRVGDMIDQGGKTGPRGGALAARFATAAVLVMLVGCGEAAQRKEAQALQRASVVSSTAPLPDRLVTPAEIESVSDALAKKTFLQLWSLLQFRSWDRAATLFEPGLRRTVGLSTLTAGLEANLLVWQATKPKITSAGIAGGRATVTFLARDERNNVTPAAITFRGGKAHWHVMYFSMLNFALQRAVQTRVQGELEPLATKPNVEAVRQGLNASRLQNLYLERLTRSEAAKRKTP